MTSSRRSSVATALLALVFTIAGAANAFAQSDKTYVSGVGDDANTCGRTDPCKTFPGAISRTNAGGVISVMDSGGFGSVTITKSITIDGGSHLGGVLASSTFGITINAGAGGVVVLRNLSLEGFSGSTYGVKVNSAQSVHIEHCTIVGFGNRGIDFNASTTSMLTMNDVSIRQSGYGVEVHNGHVTAEQLTLQQNTNGLLVSGPAHVSVRNSLVSGSLMGFIAAYDSHAMLIVENSVATGNEWGVVAGTGATVRLANSRIIGNFTTGLYNDGASFIVSMGGNAVTGNTTDGSFTSTITIR